MQPFSRNPRGTYDAIQHFPHTRNKSTASGSAVALLLTTVDLQDTATLLEEAVDPTRANRLRRGLARAFQADERLPDGLWAMAQVFDCMTLEAKDAGIEPLKAFVAMVLLLRARVRADPHVQQ
jgi:hypothetical protein